jgi:hypothetical protein
MPVSDPQFLPMLGRGRHRNPRRGACFMELASYLAGERWSDHPACTHPLLARMARLVNDMTADEARPRLAPLIPSVIGLTSTDPRWDHEIALAAATTALPVAPEDRQRALAVGILTCERLLAAQRPREGAALQDRSREALDGVPLAARWAERFVAAHNDSRFTRHPGTDIVDFSVQGIAVTGRSDADDLLRGMLTDAIAVCRRLAGDAVAEDVPALDEVPWADVCVAAPRS